MQKWLTLVIKKNMKELNAKWPEILDHLCRILIVGYSGSEETNVLLNVISHQPDIGKNYL